VTPAHPGRPALPRIPYGAVYFRKSNPPPEDWARDYATAGADGMNLFRHWFLWSAIEVAPGEWDWADYDRQLDLAAGNGLGTIVAEMLTAAPEWAWRRYAHARYQDAAGRPAHSQYSASCATGGFPGLCLDNRDVLEAAGGFLTALATRYRGHPGLAGYDVWNEGNISPRYCYCPATVERFRAWLRERYATPRALGAAWRRYSYATWEDVEPPRTPGPYPEVMDWLRFRIDNAFRLLRWRVETLRAADPDHLIAAHGVAGSLDNLAAGACDEWRAAAEVETWGFTWVASRKGDEPWKQWHAVDLVRAGATSGGAGGGGAGLGGAGAGRPKPFWHAEAQAGPLWLQPQVLGRPREDGRISAPEDVRLWNMTSFAGGATGILYPRWRPLLDGPLFGAFGAYGMDGSRTPRSEMAGRVARWANASEQADLWRARPVRGDVGVLVAPESQLFCYAQQGSTDWYAQAARGAYRGFFERSAQPDWVRADGRDDLGAYRLLYLPFPVHLASETVERLRRWVEAGGALVSEGCPGYWGEGLRVGPTQPGPELAALLGAGEAYVEFTPDLLDGLELVWETAGAPDGPAPLPVPGGIFLQAYDSVGGRAVGRFLPGAAGPAAGRVAAVEHRFGRGRTLLVGTFPGYGHFHHPSAGSRHFFGALLDWAGVTPRVEVLAPGPEEGVVGGAWYGVTARLHAPPGDAAPGYLWVTNPAREEHHVALRLTPGRAVRGPAVHLWPEGAGEVPLEAAAGESDQGQQVLLRLRLGGRDAAVLRLD
jgi:beta-galactosidase